MSVSTRVLGAVLLAASLGLGAAPRAQQAAAPAAAWPHTLTENGATVEVYQPQAISWPDQGTLNARAAMSITRPGSTVPILGTVEVAFATRTDMTTREVTLSDPKLVASHFPALDTGQAVRLDQRIKTALGGIAAKEVPLDAIVLSLKDAKPPAPVALNNDPPEIFHSARPASLVVFDGDPVLAPVGSSGSRIRRQHQLGRVPRSGRQRHLVSAEQRRVVLPARPPSGPYKPVDEIAGGVQQDPERREFRGGAQEHPGAPGQDQRDAPTIFVSTKPAEIIVTTGPPAFAPVPGTALQQVRNSNATLFLDTGTGRFYYLISGRWFASTGLDGPWTFATPDLPPDFAMIPPSSAAGGVLAVGARHRAGAASADRRRRSPTRRRSSATRRSSTVAYVGEPRFQADPRHERRLRGEHHGSGAGGRAANITPAIQGAWFVGASPTGPWALAESVPAAIYTIPPS